MIDGNQTTLWAPYRLESLGTGFAKVETIDAKQGLAEASVADNLQLFFYHLLLSFAPLTRPFKVAYQFLLRYTYQLRLLFLKFLLLRYDPC
jgi:hypothetical protein